MKDLYKKNCECIDSIEEMILYYRKQNYNMGNRLEEIVLDKLSVFVEQIVKLEWVTESTLSELLTPLFNARKYQDYILLADIYQFQIVPFLMEWQNQMREVFEVEIDYWEQNINAIKDEKLKSQLLSEGLILDEFQYNIEDTNIGGKTLQISDNKRVWYLHSNGNPWAEGRVFSEEYYDVNVSEYGVLGFGLGYHVEQLWKKNKNMQITVFETNLEVLKIAMKYCDLRELLSAETVTIIYDNNLDILGKWMMSFEGSFLVYAPALGYIKNQKQKEYIEEYFMHLSSIKNQGNMLKQNYRQNEKNFAMFVDGLKDKWKGKEIILIAGGPSLDESLQTIKELRENRIVLAVGTVFKKLLREGIKPDYVIITDAKDSMKAQVEGVNISDVPLLYMSTISPEVLKAYKGQQYCILQRGFEAAEKYAKERNLETYDTGGSVSTTALELAIRLGQKKVYCFGLDLAYTEKKTHATGTLRYKEADVSGMREVKAVDGSSVHTIKNLDNYRHWIERRIRDEEEIKFVNVSRGAYINGMKNVVSLKEYQ